MELSAVLNVATDGGADESAPTEATEVRTNSSPSNPFSNSSGLCGSFFSSVVLPAHKNCLSSDAQGTVTTAAGGCTDQAGEHPAKRQRSDCAVAERNRTETESSTTREVEIPSAVSSGDVRGLRCPKQDHYQQQAEHEQRVLLGGDTASFPNEGKAENVSSVSAEPEGDAFSGVSTGIAAKGTTHSDGEQRGGISLGVFFGTGGDGDIDLDSLFTAQHVRPPSRDSPPRPLQTDGEAAICLGEPSASVPLAGSQEGDASTAVSTAAVVATRAAAATEATTPSTVAVESCAMATSPNGSQVGPHTTLSEGTPGGVVKDENTADAASLTAAANEADCEGPPVANSDPAAVDTPSLAIPSGACNDSSRASVISNGSSTAANALCSSKSSSGADAINVDSSATGRNTSSSSTSVLGRVESVEDVNEVIDLSNVEVVDSDNGLDVPVVDVETEAVCLDSLPASSEGSSAGLQSGGPQRPLPRFPTAVVLDSDDDDVVELSCRQGVPFSVQQYNNYVMRHPMYPHSMAAGFTGMPMNAHFRHRPLQEEMTQLGEDDEASSNPTLPRCPICLKRYRQQQQESEATRSQQKSDVNDGIQSHTAEESDNPTSESSQNLSTNTSTGHENWDKPPPPPQNSAESDKDHVVALKCGHVFCKGCIQVALRTRRQCPVCRVVLRGNRPYQRIFL